MYSEQHFNTKVFPFLNSSILGVLKFFLEEVTVETHLKKEDVLWVEISFGALCLIIHFLQCYSEMNFSPVTSTFQIKAKYF